MTSLHKILGIFLTASVLNGCASLGPARLDETHLRYNEAIKRTAEEQLLLNIVRLRYTETPSSLAISAIAAQFERTQSAGLLPFFTAAGGDLNRSFTTVLPQLQVQGADRPTFSLTPQDDQEFTRKLFTPLPLSGVLYLAKTTWPISTVFRLYLENLNWVSNAQTASGPTPKKAPDVFEFLRGVEALQTLQDQGLVVFGNEEREETLGPPLPASSLTPADLLEATKQGYQYRPGPDKRSLVLVRKTATPVLRVSRDAKSSPALATFTDAFNLQTGVAQYDITQESLLPFTSAARDQRLTQLDLETRSLLQALYYVAHGVEIPPEHLSRGVLTQTLDAQGQAFDWQKVTNKFFRVRWAQGESRPELAHVAVRYRNYWYFLDDTDQESKAVFSLLMELGRLELSGKPGPAPQLSLPLGGR